MNKMHRLHIGLILFLCLILAFSILLFSTVQAAPTNPGTTNLEAWWKLDEESGTRDDAHGSNDLSDNNTVGFTAGKYSNAASFILANSEYLSIGDNNSLSTGDIDFTLGCWVEIASKPGTP